MTVNVYPATHLDVPVDLDQALRPHSLPCIRVRPQQFVMTLGILLSYDLERYFKLRARGRLLAVDGHHHRLVDVWVCAA